MITTFSFLSKTIVGQKCIYYASESDNKEMYSLFSLKFKTFYERQSNWWFDVVILHSYGVLKTALDCCCHSFGSP